MGKKVTIMGGKGIIKCLDIKQPSLGRGSTKLVFTLSYSDGVQKIEELVNKSTKKKKKIHLLVLHCYDKTNFPLIRVTSKL
jgi:hypothetical protein